MSYFLTNSTTEFILLKITGHCLFFFLLRLLFCFARHSALLSSLLCLVVCFACHSALLVILRDSRRIYNNSLFQFVVAVVYKNKKRIGQLHIIDSAIARRMTQP
jgi:hypothetical protein